MTTKPEDIVNRALAAIGSPHFIGDLQEGTEEAKPALQIYVPTIKQISRAAHWNCLRRKQSLTLLNDSTGQTTAQQTAAGGPVTVGTGTIGQQPWVYEYAWPTDGLKARFVPMQWQPMNASTVPGQITLPNVPIMTGLTTPPSNYYDIPTPFVVSSDTVPTLVGVPGSWADFPDYADIEGRAPSYQTVILSNQPNATLVYTCFAPFPDQWDPMLQQAIVAALASQLAMAVLKDPKVAIQVRAQQIAVAKAALEAARISDGNEGWNDADHIPDWIRTRNRGFRGYGWGWNGPGQLWIGWDSCSWADGSVF